MSVPKRTMYHSFHSLHDDVGSAQGLLAQEQGASAYHSFTALCGIQQNNPQQVRRKKSVLSHAA